ncbi:hypothetical protein LPJ61_002688 [Coemansia biformis]|uniref:Uncharacterized protein n=1 Tax=Coemansia biformis TaxID=1286918 RepID=A0A9W7YEA6_9FUNG|nr:hypothetical protein LPJ61_002688 [Coemansia biformis]
MAPAPEVIVFGQPAATKPSGSTSSSSKFAYKSFMSSKISKIGATPPKPKTEKERKEEEDDLRHDRELKELLEGKMMIEKLHEAQLTGKDRHKHNTEKLAKLGMKVKTKLKMPADMYFASQRNRTVKANKEIKDAKDRGILTAAMKRGIETVHLGKPVDTNKHRHRHADKGPNAGPGKFKDGVLHISKSHINRVTSKPGATARVGKPGNKGNKGKKGNKPRR